MRQWNNEKLSNEKINNSFYHEFEVDENYFSIALKNSSIIVALVDRDLCYRWIYNPHPDFKAFQVIGKRDDEINECKGSEKLMELKKKVIETGKSGSEIISFDLKAGRRFYNVTAEPFYNEDGAVIGATTASMDITEYEKMKRQLIKYEKFSVIEKLAAGVAHEFNNILAVIMGNIQLMIKRNQRNKIMIKDKDLARLELIIDNCERAKEITYNLLKIADPKPVCRKYCDVTKTIDEIISLFRKDFIHNNIEVIRKYRLYKMIKVDEDQLKHVFMNLISNSIHAIIPKERGKIIIYVYEIGDNIVIIFSDTGIGMDKEIQKNIFEPFFTTKGGYSKGKIIDGTGLGLSISYKYIKNHKGTIEVKSSKDKGTVMVIRLPKVD